MRLDLILRGDLVLQDRVLKGGFLGVRDGRIELIGSGEAYPDADSLEDYTGCLLFPGLIDAQVHAGSVEGTGGLADATLAAAAGGVTTIVDMPFDNPTPVDTSAGLRSKIADANRMAHVDVALYATAPKGGAADAIRLLVEAGACAIKLSTYGYHPTRFPRSTMGEMLDVFVEAANLDIPVAFHNEDQEIVDHLARRIREGGQTGPETHGLTRPALAEMIANAQVLELGLHTGARAHIVHSSLVEGFAMVKRYRRQGARPSAETCLQYLIFDEADFINKGAVLKQTPPYRSEPNRTAMWLALADGDIEIVSTDHCAWPLSTRLDPDMFRNSSGMPGLETLLPVFFSELYRRGLSPTIVAKVCAHNVAQHFGFDGFKGSLAIGKDADVAVLRRVQHVFHAADMASAVKWSPYDGFLLEGTVAATFLRGKKIFAEGRLLQPEPTGRFIQPSRNQAKLL